MSQRATILGCFCVLQRISACLAYFSLNIFSEPMNNKGTKTRRNSFNRRERSEQSSAPCSLLPPVEVRRHSQLIPTYSSLFQHIFCPDPGAGGAMRRQPFATTNLERPIAKFETNPSFRPAKLLSPSQSRARSKFGKLNLPNEPIRATT